MSRYTKTGLYREMRVRVCMPEQKDIVWRSHPKPGYGYSLDDLDGMIERAAGYLEKHLPSCEFRMVEIAPNVVNFIYAGRKGKPMEERKVTSCPEGGQAPAIAQKVCAADGHKINVFQKGMRQGAQGPELETIIFCSLCGFGLSEIRGEIDKQIADAIARGINAAQNPPPVPGAKGPFPIDTSKAAGA